MPDVPRPSDSHSGIVPKPADPSTWDVTSGGRELGEVISYAIAAHKKGIDVDRIFTVSPSDANGYLGAFIVKAIEHHFPALANSTK